MAAARRKQDLDCGKQPVVLYRFIKKGINGQEIFADVVFAKDKGQVALPVEIREHEQGDVTETWISSQGPGKCDTGMIPARKAHLEKYEIRHDGLDQGDDLFNLSAEMNLMPCFV